MTGRKMGHLRARLRHDATDFLMKMNISWELITPWGVSVLRRGTFPLSLLYAPSQASQFDVFF